MSSKIDLLLYQFMALLLLFLYQLLYSILIKEKSKHIVNLIDKKAGLNKSACDGQNHMVLDTSNGKKPEHGKITNYVRNYGEQPQTANKNSVIIVGILLT